MMHHNLNAFYLHYLLFQFIMNGLMSTSLPKPNGHQHEACHDFHLQLS